MQLTLFQDIFKFFFNIILVAVDAEDKSWAFFSISGGHCLISRTTCAPAEFQMEAFTWEIVGQFWKLKVISKLVEGPKHWPQFRQTKVALGTYTLLQTKSSLKTAVKHKSLGLENNCFYFVQRGPDPDLLQLEAEMRELNRSSSQTVPECQKQLPRKLCVDNVNNANNTNVQRKHMFCW